MNKKVQAQDEALTETRHKLAKEKDISHTKEDARIKMVWVPVEIDEHEGTRGR